ncbi:MAG: caspase family protein [Candidatus Lokiarchaeota archaeon]|nr:caspase family protein [Candidatus Lokiarchaeota archaeon]
MKHKTNIIAVMVIVGFLSFAATKMESNAITATGSEDPASPPVDGISPLVKEPKPGLPDILPAPSSPTKGPGGPSSYPEGYAVIAGVSDYPGTSHDLQYSDDDAVDVNNLVLNTFHVPSSNVVCLTNSQATTSAITSAVTSFAGAMDADDTLFFYFSGHGSTAEDVDSYSWSVQSAHPYSNNMDSYWHYSVPGVHMMRVHFVRVDTESGYDAVFIGDNADRSSYWDYFTGGPYYSVWSYWVLTDDIYVNLYTDYSVTDWGFQVDLVETMTWVSPQEFIPYDGISDGFTGPELDALFDTVPGRIISVFDTCHSGGVGSAVQATGRYSMTASQWNEFSLEDSAAYNGVFTRYFLLPWTSTYDTNADGVVAFEETFGYISSNSVSRSTALGSVHHPQEYDGIAGSTIFQPNAKIESNTVDGSFNTSVNFFLNGLGWGELFCVYYDKTTKSYMIQCNESSILPSNSTISRTITAPTGGFTTSAVTTMVNARYGTYVEQANSSLDLSGPAFNSTSDWDGDGLSDLHEFNHGTNMWSVDSDGDGMRDAFELQYSLDPYFDDSSFDPDNDGIPNIGEFLNGLNPNAANNFTDKDSDGLFDNLEYIITSNISNPDTDGDGMRDDWEYNFAPAVNILVPDAGLDPDGDGLTNIQEFQHSADPGSTDTDSDGMPDDWEHAYGLILALNDALGDLDRDNLSNYQEFLEGADPSSRDTDSDGLDDYLEHTLGTNLNSTESDGDGFSDYYEYTLGSDPGNAGDTPLLHVFAFAVIIVLIIVAVVAAKQRGKNHVYPRPRPPGPRPSDLSRHTPIARPSTQMAYSQRPYGSPPTYYRPPYGSIQPRTSSQPTIVLPYQIQRQLEALPPYERERVRALLIQKVLEKLEADRRAAQQRPTPRFCVKCGTPLVAGRCPSCGYSFPPSG